MKSGINLEALDRSARPQDDLFRFVNGTWLDTTEIPDDRARFGTFDILREESTARVRDLIEEAAARPRGRAPGTPKRQVGDLYASFTDTDRIEELGLSPAAGDALGGRRRRPTSTPSARPSAASTRDGVDGAAAALRVARTSARPEDYVVYLEQGGLGLPDESYYREEKYADIRTAYVAHVGRLLGLAGIPDAEAKATRIMALETLLACVALGQGRQPRRRSRPTTPTPSTRRRRSRPSSLGTPGCPASRRRRVVRQGRRPAAELRHRPRATRSSRRDIDDWRAWLTWHVLSEFAPLLPQSFVDEDFDFFGRTLSGQPENKERWKRGVSVVESCVGEAVGQLYAERWFPPAAKERMQELVANLVEAFRRSFSSLEWMGPETRAQALDKLDAFTPEDRLPRRVARLLRHRDRPGRPRRQRPARHRFRGRPQPREDRRPDRPHRVVHAAADVNAYYMPSMNEIVFPAAILQPPFFDLEADDAVNYGGIGAVIGHELGHGFDDQGSRYDGTGALRDWWTEADRERFDALSQRLIEQFNALHPGRALDESHKVNGALTVGENIGDLGGLQIGYSAYRIATEGAGMPEIDGFTGPQRFFIGWAQVWKGKAREAEAIRLLAIDPHSPQDVRGNAVRNLTRVPRGVRRQARRRAVARRRGAGPHLLIASPGIDRPVGRPAGSVVELQLEADVGRHEAEPLVEAARVGPARVARQLHEGGTRAGATPRPPMSTSSVPRPDPRSASGDADALDDRRGSRRAATVRG